MIWSLIKDKVKVPVFYQRPPSARIIYSLKMGEIEVSLDKIVRLKDVPELYNPIALGFCLLCFREREKNMEIFCKKCSNTPVVVEFFDKCHTAINALVAISGKLDLPYKLDLDDKADPEKYYYNRFFFRNRAEADWMVKFIEESREKGLGRL